jgi:rRNA processing protein Krr1/Pno1
MFSDKELCYGPGTQVLLRPVSSSSDKEFTISGQVLMCQLEQQATASLNSTSEQDILAIKQNLSINTDDEVIQNETVALLAKELVAKWKEIASQGGTNEVKTNSCQEFLYTIKVQHCSGSFHLEENVSVDRVKYRYVQSANPNHQAVSEPNQQPDRTGKIESKPQAREEAVNSTANAKTNLSFQEHEGCRMASPSTLTQSDTTMGHPNSDSHSQQNSYKRKFEPDQLEESTEPKRPCPSIAEDICIALNQQPSGSRGDFFAQVSLLHHHVPQLVGTGGKTIRDIESATGCVVDIRGRGSKQYLDEPLHAKVTGSTQAEVDGAVQMIQDKIRDFENKGDSCEFLPLPNDSRLSKLIGPSGEKIRNIRTKSGCSIAIRGEGIRNDTKNDEPTHAKIVGASEDIAKAKHMIQAALAGNCESLYDGSNNLVTIPLRREHITRIVGSKGSIVKDLEKKSGCSIAIDGKGSSPHARIVGSNSFGVKVAVELIESRIREIEREDGEEGEIVEPTSLHGSSSYVDSGRRFDTSVALNADNRPVAKGGVYCKINIPPWLVYDDSSKARLHRECIATIFGFSLS